MTQIGQDIIDVGLSRRGETYVFGAVVPLDNPNWHGPWDCAEFTSWAAYQAYGLIFGAGRVSNPSKADPYSGHWFTEAKKYGTVISWQDALDIPGAAVIRSPVPGKIGHVALCIGDGNHTLEARGKAYGVDVFDKAKSRAWSIGCLLPGVEYGSATTVKPIAGPLDKAIKQVRFPEGYLWLKAPRFKSGSVVALQRALLAQKVDPGPIDGDFGPITHAAVLSFQVREGLEVDGVVGPMTSASLKLSFPIVATPADNETHAAAVKPTAPSMPISIEPSKDIDTVVSISPRGSNFNAKTAAGSEFIVGTSTSYTDDMMRVGLRQGKAAIASSLQFGVYRAEDYTAAFDKWAYFISPTLNAEGSARFATLNTYDRAAFTFGAPQLAAHTPNLNFVVYLRELLALPNADKHFPELSLRPNANGKTTVHLADGGSFRDLEEVVLVTRPNGKKENQLARLMAYLNPSPVKIDDAELSAAARLMNWMRLDPAAKQLQISVFIGQGKDALQATKKKVPAFSGKDWAVALWIMDILHQGRGTYAEIAAALATANAQANLQKIGAQKYKTRVATVAAAIKDLDQRGILNGFQV